MEAAEGCRQATEACSGDERSSRIIVEGQPLVRAGQQLLGEEVD
jgi:hypothetical protein